MNDISDMGALSKMSQKNVNMHRESFEDSDVPLTLAAVRECMPKRFKSRVTDKFLDTLNDITGHSEVRDAFRENIIGYSSVLQTPGVKLNNYIQAVRYVSYKMLGYSNKESWIRAFPERYQRMVSNETSDDTTRAIVSKYNRGVLVNKILEQTMVPTYILNHDMYQKAVNIQAQLMLTATSEKVRSDAANSLLMHLKQPEVTKATLDINVKEDDSIKELRNTTLELVKQQRLMLESGVMNTKEVAESKILLGEFTEVGDD